MGFFSAAVLEESSLEGDLKNLWSLGCARGKSVSM